MRAAPQKPRKCAARCSVLKACQHTGRVRVGEDLIPFTLLIRKIKSGSCVAGVEIVQTSLDSPLPLTPCPSASQEHFDLMRTAAKQIVRLFSRAASICKNLYHGLFALPDLLR